MISAEKEVEDSFLPYHDYLYRIHNTVVVKILFIDFFFLLVRVFKLLFIVTFITSDFLSML